MGVSQLTTQRRSIVSVFGSSRPGPDQPEYAAALEVGRLLAAAGFTVCNGGYGGIMEASARGAKEARGHTMGVISSSFGELRANRWIDEIVTEKSLVDRLMKLISVADAYVILKGGTGTLLELAAVWEFMNKNIMQKKPCVAVGGFWNGVIQTLKDELAWEGFGHATHLMSTTDTPVECVEILKKALGVYEAER